MGKLLQFGYLLAIAVILPYQMDALGPLAMQGLLILFKLFPKPDKKNPSGILALPLRLLDIIRHKGPFGHQKNDGKDKMQGDGYAAYLI